jgi:hypothetical protein
MQAFDQVNYEYFAKKELKSVEVPAHCWRYDTVYAAEVREEIMR